MTDQNTAFPPKPRQRAEEELSRIALEHFAYTGFGGTSLQQIADAAGYSKSSVLYHFASKEALLEAVITPAIDALEQILAGVSGVRVSKDSRVDFVEKFIDFLLEYRLEVHVFINQGQSLVGVQVIDRANAMLERLAASLVSDFRSTEEKIRFALALGGAAYALVAGMNFGDELLPDDEVRSALIITVTELLTPAVRSDQQTPPDNTASAH